MKIDWKKVWDALGGRKFLAFAIACLFLALGKISDTIWATAFGLYVGANVAQKVLLERRSDYAGETQEALVKD